MNWCWHLHFFLMNISWMGVELRLERRILELKIYRLLLLFSDLLARTTFVLSRLAWKIDQLRSRSSSRKTAIGFPEEQIIRPAGKGRREGVRAQLGIVFDRQVFHCITSETHSYDEEGRTLTCLVIDKPLWGPLWGPYCTCRSRTYFDKKFASRRLCPAMGNSESERSVVPFECQMFVIFCRERERFKWWSS